jgi:hypothetical protein
MAVFTIIGVVVVVALTLIGLAFVWAAITGGL